METRYAGNGTVRSAHFDRPGGSQMQVSHGMHGERRIETCSWDRLDAQLHVTAANRQGRIERPCAYPHPWPRGAVKVDVKDPLERHRELLTRYTDADMHNMLAYLETLK